MSEEDERAGRPQSPRDPEMIAYNVRDRGEDKDAAWNRVGAAWPHRDGAGYDVKLDAIPVDGRVSLREAKKQFAEKRSDGRRPKNRERDYER